jgi:hypothetical protein
VIVAKVNPLPYVIHRLDVLTALIPEIAGWSHRFADAGIFVWRSSRGINHFNIYVVGSTYDTFLLFLLLFGYSLLLSQSFRILNLVSFFCQYLTIELSVFKPRKVRQKRWQCLHVLRAIRFARAAVK